jgi:hypothetical protein
MTNAILGSLPVVPSHVSGAVLVPYMHLLSDLVLRVQSVLATDTIM